MKSLLRGSLCKENVIHYSMNFLEEIFKEAAFMKRMRLIKD